VTNRIPPERLAYVAQGIHSLGERPLFEFLREIEAGPRRSAQGAAPGPRLAFEATLPRSNTPTPNVTNKPRLTSGPKPELALQSLDELSRAAPGPRRKKRSPPMRAGRK
jgi:hypothetical protein